VCEKVAKEFVIGKLEKMRASVTWYLWLQKSLTEIILFKNQESHLNDVKDRLSKGEGDVETELERIMREEAEEIVNKHFDNNEGDAELYQLLKQFKNSKNIFKSILDVTELDQKYKLSKMAKTFEFTRSGNMLLHYIELICAIVISNTHNFCYMAMIFAMF
jgi:hypothetical protein